MANKSYPLSKVYGLLEPGPVVLVTTAGVERPNIMTLSWHTMLEFVPPLVGCVISNRNYSFARVQATGECVINIPTVELAAQVVGYGNTSGQRPTNSPSSASRRCRRRGWAHRSSPNALPISNAA